MTAWLMCLALLAEVVPPASLLGEVRHVGAAQDTTLVLHVERKDSGKDSGKDERAENVRLTGELASEVDHLGGFKVEVVGHRDAESFVVESYRIVDIGDGARPLVGNLVEIAGGLALSDGEAAPIPLSLAASSKVRLAPQVGAKIWVHGKKLLSGELQVARYGILRPARKAAMPAPKSK